MVLTHCFKLPLSKCWPKRALTIANSIKSLKMINQQPSQQQQRFKSEKVDCSHLVPKCGDRFKQKPCDPAQLTIKLKQPAPEPLPENKRTIKINRPVECCGDPCQDAFPRFDTLYYKRTDKLKREYQQTWSECPELLKKPKLICQPDKIKYPKLKKRTRQQRPATACKQVCLSTNNKCPFITSTGCRQAMHPPKCRPSRVKALCVKRKAPFPAFSECSRKKPRPKHPLECNCLVNPSMCEVWAKYHYLQRIKRTGLC